MDDLNHQIELLHDPTHVRSYTAKLWQSLFAANRLNVEALERRGREMPGGLTIQRWCELGNSGSKAVESIQALLAAAPAAWRSELEIAQDADGGFRIPVRMLMILGGKPPQAAP